MEHIPTPTPIEEAMIEEALEEMIFNPQDTFPDIELTELDESNLLICDNETGSSSPDSVTFSSESNYPVTSRDRDSTLECLVCGQPAGRHIYYGVQSCHSCRAFFRRTIQSGKRRQYKCKRDGKCQIESKSWRSCQKCRLEKCLAVGMAEHLVLDDSQRKQRNEVIKKNRSERSEQALVKIVPKPPKDLFTTEERMFFTGLHATMFKESADMLFRTYASNLELGKNMLEYIYHKSWPDMKNLMHMAKSMETLAMSVMSRLTDLRILCPEDLRALVNENYKLVYWSNQAGSFRTTANCNLMISKMKCHYMELSSYDDDVADLVNKVSFMTMDDTPTVNPILDEVNSACYWNASKEDTQRYVQLAELIGDWYLSKNKVCPDELQGLFFSLVLVCSTTNVPLQNPAGVEQLQAKYLYMLQKYLHVTYSQEVAKKKFQGAIGMISLVREMVCLRDKAIQDATS